MTALFLLAAVMALRADAPALTLAEAKAMSAAKLGDALLARGHPEIVEARVGTQGMMPPPPPGQPFQSPIELTTAGSASSRSGFCERTVVKILLAPVVYVGYEAPAAPPVRLTTEQTYSWKYDSGARAGCNASDKQYFQVDEHDEARAFHLVRSLAAVQRLARAGRRTGVEWSIDDREARRRREWANTDGSFRKRMITGEMAEITDPAVAMARLPLGDISSVSRQRSWVRSLTNADLTTKGGKRREAASIFAGGVWSVETVLEQGRVAVIRMVREMPPPF